MDRKKTENYVLYAEQGPYDLKREKRDKKGVRGLNEPCVNKEKQGITASKGMWR